MAELKEGRRGGSETGSKESGKSWVRITFWWRDKSCLRASEVQVNQRRQNWWNAWEVCQQQEDRATHQKNLR